VSDGAFDVHRGTTILQTDLDDIDDGTQDLMVQLTTIAEFLLEDTEFLATLIDVLVPGLRDTEKFLLGRIRSVGSNELGTAVDAVGEAQLVALPEDASDLSRFGSNNVVRILCRVPRLRHVTNLVRVEARRYEVTDAGTVCLVAPMTSIEFPGDRVPVIAAFKVDTVVERENVKVRHEAGPFGKAVTPMHLK
jgi:hypothetical protein